MKQDIVIVNTGCANIASVRYAFERLAVAVSVSDDPARINRADKVILPGVGSAQAAMTSLHQKGLVEPLQQLTQPVLGVCLGMQMMVDASAESRDGDIPCLGLIPGRVERLQAEGLRLPHMGWNTLSDIAEHPLLHGIDEQQYFYFVHSFGVAVSDTTLARGNYGQPFAAVIAKGNFMGAQFHPERSGRAGARLLKNFVELVN
ncbi:imidazole glycerol phosphate synthase subunit HisH [Aestuariibacter halophilus]|uniref:Imidazole glycerol phosphate synthase subunit HisH n=1 Tax=Fluctibacter halophilus TaxID=226011 RepID=A0ABS8GAM9_9ALTE|nr:imidazole glycerol phosphate synthase subunit HisH [Aestuariibacter halophilus]MCC2616291.1 imidazole glycerol phosphate synthase subunit HisH [Aestuariibacter halophilus]